MCFVCLAVCWESIKKIIGALMGMCGKTGIMDSFNIMDLLGGLMSKFLPMKMSLEGK